MTEYLDMGLVALAGQPRSAHPDPEDFARAMAARKTLGRFMMGYRGALEEMLTKIKILKDEFELMHEYSPIEHVNSRMKSPESIMSKVELRGIERDFRAIRANIFDIAGIRITCSFISDIHLLADMLTSQKDVEILQVKDYVAHPKPNGYKSLHLIVSVPVFMSDRVEDVPVELQIRTVAMDFWASLEHKIYYKYAREVPDHILEELKRAAQVANDLDKTMENLRSEVKALKT